MKKLYSVLAGLFLLLSAKGIILHHKNSVRLNNKLKSLDLDTGPNGLGLTYTF